MVPVETLRRNLKATSDALNERQAKGLVPPSQYQEYIKKAADELLQSNVPNRIAEGEAWEYAELLIAARRWKDAEVLLKIAVKHAAATHNEDRWVNDGLRLARVEAELGEVDRAIEAARAVQTASNTGSAPILPGTLLEIVPAAHGKGKDAELADLLKGAIRCHMRTIVDPKTEPGKLFLFARPHHVRKAWETVIQLYVAAGRPDQAKSAAQEADKMLATMAQA
jgi:hypothetical protein